MGKPKKRTTSRRTKNRRSQSVLELARAVNARSPVKAYTTRRETGKRAPTGAARPAAKATKAA